eukprot:3398976-Pleurochrysis_carterae.AAC.1
MGAHFPTGASHATHALREDAHAIAFHHRERFDESHVALRLLEEMHTHPGGVCVFQVIQGLLRVHGMSFPARAEVEDQVHAPRIDETFHEAGACRCWRRIQELDGYHVHPHRHRPHWTM